MSNAGSVPDDAGEQANQTERERDADTDSNQRHIQGSAHHHREDLITSRTESQAKAELKAALSDGVRRNAIHAKRGQQNADSGEEYKECGAKVLWPLYHADIILHRGDLDGDLWMRTQE